MFFNAIINPKAVIKICRHVMGGGLKVFVRGPGDAGKAEPASLYEIQTFPFACERMLFIPWEAEPKKYFRFSAVMRPAGGGEAFDLALWARTYPHCDEVPDVAVGLTEYIRELEKEAEKYFGRHTLLSTIKGHELYPFD